MAGNNVNQLNLSLQSIIFIVSFIGAIIDSKIIDLGLIGTFCWIVVVLTVIRYIMQLFSNSDNDDNYY